MDGPAWRIHLPPGADAEALDLLAAGTLPAAWARRLGAHPDAPCLRGVDGGWMVAGEVEEATRRVAGRLLAAGLLPGDRLLLSAANSLDLALAHVGALRAGLVVVPANPAYREREIAHLVGDARPAGAVVDDPQRAAWVRTAGGADMVVVGPAVELPDSQPRPDALDAAAPGDPALLCYTSGTTGAPKGALLTHANLLGNIESVALAWRWTADDRLVLALPLFHAHGLAVGLHGTLLTGASAVLLAGFEPGAVLDAAERERATLFFGVPTMYHRLLSSPRVGELARLRLCVSGSAALPAALFRAVEEASGVALLERYGTTETLMAVSNPYDGERRPGAVGFPFPGVEVRLGSGQGEDPEGVGEVLVRGPGVFSGYLGRPEATAEAFHEGWFRTGDLGAFDGDGSLRIVGRSKEVIITGGLNVYPREVEDVLSAHPGVAEVAVVGVASAEWGETLTAFVVPDGSPPDPAELLAYAASRLASYKRPRQVRFVDALPRNALGKVVRARLTD